MEKEQEDVLKLSGELHEVPLHCGVAPYSLLSLHEVLMERDGLTEEEADAAIEEAQELVAEGADPEDVLHDEFGLEPDYVWDLIEGMQE